MADPASTPRNDPEGAKEPRPASEDVFWGVDPSTKRVAVAWTGPDRGARSVEIPVERHGKRLDTIWRLTRSLAAGVAVCHPPAFVWVEQPAAYGRQVEPELYYAVGVVQAAIYAALAYRDEFPCHVETVPVGRWKKASVGHGNATKAEVREWSAADGYGGDIGDEADAWAIAEAARREVRFG